MYVPTVLLFQSRSSLKSVAFNFINKITKIILEVQISLFV